MAAWLTQRQLSSRAATVLHCVGFGLFLSICPRGAFNALLLGTCLDGWAQLTAAQTAQLAATGLLGFALWGLFKQGVNLPRDKAARIGYAAVTLCYAAQFACGRLELGAWPVTLISLIVGVFSVYLLMLWFEIFLVVCKTAGRAACIATLCGSYGAAMALALPSALAAAHPWAVAGVALLGIAACWVCHELLQACGDFGGKALPAAAKPQPHRRYRIVFHTLVTLVSFGVTYGIAQNLASYYGGSSTAASLLSTVVISGLCFALMAVFFMWRGVQNLQFGYVVRISITVGGSILAAAALGMELAPDLMSMLFRVAGTLLGMAMILFSVEICSDTGDAALNVIAPNYSTWALVCSAAMLVSLGVLELMDPHRALDLIALAAVLATFLLIPILPSRSSNAATFTLAELPEDEGFEGRAARARESIVLRAGLSTREEEVLDLLLEGHTRQEIAERLSLSAWTVKDHTKNLYRKLDVHSAKELIALFARGE